MRRASALLLVALAAACGRGSAPATPGAARPHVLVLAAASLTEAFDDARGLIESENHLSVAFSFAGSGTLVTQVQQGIGADVIATADDRSMQQLVDAGLVETPRTFATNRLEILVAPGNPKRIESLADLGRSDVTFVTEDDSVPAGRYATQALRKAGVAVRPVSREADVKAAVARITSGEADATIVYATDVRAAGARAQGVVFPDRFNVIASYPIAVIKGSSRRAEAEAFVNAILHGPGREALAARGFGPPAGS